MHPIDKQQRIYEGGPVCCVHEDAECDCFCVQRNDRPNDLMRRLLDAMRAARKIELLIIGVMVCALLVLTIGDKQQKSDASDMEKRLSAILSQIDGAGKVSVLLSQDNAGAVIASRGADDMRVHLELQRAVRAFTGMDLDRIEIVKSGR